MKLFRHSLILTFLVFSSHTLACGKEAFGFLLGNAVPRDVKSVDEILFKGGSGPGNVIKSFLSEVPSPFPEFDKYAFWSNQDMKVVYAITAYRKQIVDKSLIYDEDYRKKLKEETKLELSRLRKIFEEKNGLEYKATSPSELTWVATPLGFRSTIGAYLGEYVYIECANISLEKKAETEAWKTILR
jgi:hypothetical protein